jgi:hypothetical protein
MLKHLFLCLSNKLLIAYVAYGITFACTLLLPVPVQIVLMLLSTVYSSYQIVLMLLSTEDSSYQIVLMLLSTEDTTSC